MSAWRGVLVAGGLALALPTPAGAQRPERGARLQPEARVDAILARRDAVELGLGASIPLGGYVRVQLVAAGGLAEGRQDRATSRADALARFVLDPYREHRWGPYGVGGISQRFEPVAATYVVIGIGLEGPQLGGVLPTLEIGLGGGTRVGIIARRAIAGAR